MTETEINVAIAEATGRYADELPDYLHDLNAMREAEEALEPQEHILYTLYLAEGIVDHSNPMDLYFLLHKSAPERVRAFLRVKCKWKD